MLGERDGERLVSDLEKAMEQVRKATEIITHLRTFGRPASISLEPIDVREAINRALSLTSEQLRQRAIDVELDLSPDDAFVLGNPIQLEQVFINLLTNARDALSEDVDEKRIRIATAREGERVKITFSDTGPGIPPGLEQRIFDPFFTTKEVGAGTGLGLSITYGIVKEHGGQIVVANGADEGACFEIELPVADEVPPEEALA
jgi:C4-dicarboxylate-specific signal transduction histidine kinase